ncbi:TerD family protein [Flavobacterium collinsii]|jgi:tellurium resistance protein TerD|uniref:General stress protein 16U n=1 Tax=Flavobacterium collinsii TaxID=1114861 RepID=A0A9W4TH38_9FLAO|nr:MULTISPECIES: TerD family protein [Flavobacterium]MDL2144927.1 TerD family protein [Flavobacterium tructae]URC14541.1 TerD family protein [Flavobacterium sp. B183]CAA9201642.1 General stress protein 16U [Flavobacterium collinsii]CAI2766837.1 Tellurium resistance protein TerE [Flavobacterium collinsii]GIQ57582.1 chemical-damaging agent resistance protein C [Flavobacterium collinsii]
MAINLQKGQRENINAPKFTIGLGWDTNSSSTGSGFDLDASVFILGDNRKIISDSHFVFYNNLTSPDDAVIHTGDNLTGDGDGDDEQVKIDLTKINSAVKEICVVVTIHDAENRKQNFGQVRNSFIRIVDDSNNSEMVKYELEEDFSIETAVEFGRIYNKDGQWKFEAIGVGMKGGLEDYLNKYN